MSTNGHLKFQGTNRATFVGATSNIMFDTTSTSLGIGVSGTDHPSSNLYITGNAYVTSDIGVGGVLTMGTVNVVARHDLESVTATGNTTPLTVEFQNADTSLVASGNVETKNINMLHTANTASIKLNSNVVTEFPRSKKLIKYPRVALTSASRNAYENGYKVTFSSEYSTTTWAAEHVFDSDATDNPGSWASGGSKYTSGGQTYSGGASIGGFSGEYVHLELPVSINLSLVRMLPRTYQIPCPQAPKNYSIIASTDGVTYDLLERVINEPDSGTFKEIHINTSKSYNRFAIVVEKTIGSDVAAISEIEYYGVPEYDPEAHGTDVVVKSDANVPSTDWLERYYDARNYLSGTTILDEVTATHRDATINGTVPLDTSDGIKSWSFTGNASNFISGDDTIDGVPAAGDWVHSISVWFKTTSMADNQYIMMILPSANLDGSSPATGSTIAFYLRRKALADGVDSRRRLQIVHWSQDVRLDYTFSENEWYNLTYTYSSGGTTSATERAYVNGLYVPFIESTRTAATTGDNLNISSSSRVVLGKRYKTSSPFPFHGNIANFRIFKRALSSYEVWQLYAYQKEYFGHGDLSMTLNAGQLGIGTSKPRAALDVRGNVQVRGDIHGGCPVFFTAYASMNGTVTGSSAGTIIVFNKTTVNKGGAYDTTNGRCTFPVSGYYEVFFRGGTAGTADFHAHIYRNGDAPGSGGWPDNLPRLWDATDKQYRNAGTIQFFYYFTAGEYIEVRLVSSSVFNADNYNSFSVKYLSN